MIRIKLNRFLRPTIEIDFSEESCRCTRFKYFNESTNPLVKSFIFELFVGGGDMKLIVVILSLA